MGCIGSRDTEASAIKNHPFSRVDADQFCKEVWFHGKPGTLSAGNFRRLCHSLGIDYSACSAYQSFQEALLKNEVYSTHTLFLLGLLMGRGTFRVKSTLWFESCDQGALNALSRSDFVLSLSQLLDIGMQFLPLLSSSSFTGHSDPQSLAHSLVSHLISDTVTINEVQQVLPRAVFYAEDLLALCQEKTLFIEPTLSTLGSPTAQPNTCKFTLHSEEHLDSESEDVDSEESSVVVQVCISSAETSSFLLHRRASDEATAETFSIRHSLDLPQKQQLLNSIRTIRHSLGERWKP